MSLFDKGIRYLYEKKKDSVDPAKFQSQLLKTFSFTSVGGGSGASTVLLYIAQYLAKEEEKQVCILDLNFFQPDILYNLNVDVTVENTVVNYLKGFKKLEDCFIQDQVLKNLYLVTVSPKEDISLLLNLKTDSDIIGNLIDRLQVFDYVLINLPYIQPLITFIEPISRIDRGYLVVDERMSGINKIQEILNFLHVYQAKWNNFKYVILNKRTDYDYPEDKINEISGEIVSSIPFSENLIHSMNVKKPLISQNIPKKVQLGFAEVLEHIKQ